jgi:hypothetical protein
MSDLKDHDIEILWHSLGVSPEKRTPYRNHFCSCTDETESDLMSIRRLEKAGYMLRFKSAFDNQNSMCFTVTESGKRFALENLPVPEKLSKSKIRYQLWKEYQDCFDVSFGDWLKEPYFDEMRKKARC